MSLLRPVKLGELLGDIRLEQQIFRFLGAFAGAAEILRCLHVITALSGNHADVPEDFTTP